MAESGAREIIQLLASKFQNPRSRWPPFPANAGPEVEDVYTDLWEYDLSVAGMVSRVVESAKPPVTKNWASPRLRRRIEGLLERAPRQRELLTDLLEVYGGLQEMIGIVERLRRARRA